MDPQRLIGQSMDTDDHCGRYVGLLQQPAPLRDSLTVAGEDDRFRRRRWNVYRDLPSTVVLERLRDKLSPNRVGGLRGRSGGPTWLVVDLIACLLLHRLGFIYSSVVAPGNSPIPVVPLPFFHTFFSSGLWTVKPGRNTVLTRTPII